MKSFEIGSVKFTHNSNRSEKDIYKKMASNIGEKVRHMLIFYLSFTIKNLYLNSFCKLFQKVQRISQIQKKNLWTICLQIWNLLEGNLEALTQIIVTGRSGKP